MFLCIASHLLRIIDKAIDFNFIYDEVENLYSNKGRPGIDPVSLFKIVFIQYLFEIRSMRQTIHQLYGKLDLTNTQIVALDAGYKTPSVLRKIFLSGKLPAIPYTRPMTKDGFFRKSEYVYGESEKIGIEKTQILFIFHDFSIRAKFKVLLNFN